MLKYPVSRNKTFRALADPTRREILALLRHGEITAGALAEEFDMTKPAMSHHFSVLKDADGLAWESEKLSDEGVRITDIAGGILHGMGWDRKSDRETPFALDLLTGVRIPARE